MLVDGRREVAAAHARDHPIDDDLKLFRWNEEKLGGALGFADRRVKGDLERFKQFIESGGHETGAWRGEVPREG